MQYEAGRDMNVEPIRADAISDFGNQLERYGHQLDALTERLGPILSLYAKATRDDPDEVPRPEESSALRARIRRLSDLNDRLDAILSDIDL